jgi:hypothetical protein
MAETRHTPGPWYAGVLSGPEDEKTVSVGPYDKPIHYEDAVCECWQGEHNAIANARLIAAAPELLYYLNRILEDLPRDRDWLDPSIERQAIAAIKSATGTAP